MINSQEYHSGYDGAATCRWYWYLSLWVCWPQMAPKTQEKGEVKEPSYLSKGAWKPSCKDLSMGGNISGWIFQRVITSGGFCGGVTKPYPCHDSYSTLPCPSLSPGVCPKYQFRPLLKLPFHFINKIFYLGWIYLSLAIVGTVYTEIVLVVGWLRTWSLDKKWETNRMILLPFSCMEPLYS